MNIIFCSGMMRSGSTWSYNVCRIIGMLIAEQTQSTLYCGYRDSKSLDEFLREKIDSAIVVYKLHSPASLALELIRNKNAKNICTVRDPRDCVASRQLIADESLDVSINFIKDNLYYVDLYKQINNTLFIRYEEMILHPLEQIREIADYLGIRLPTDILLEIDKQTSLHNAKKICDSLKYKPRESLLNVGQYLTDPVTCLHENHIHGGVCGRWKTELSREQIDRVVKEFTQWLISLEYETEESIEDILLSLN
jgi:hypothetical protein